MRADRAVGSVDIAFPSATDSNSNPKCIAFKIINTSYFQLHQSHGKLNEIPPEFYNWIVNHTFTCVFLSNHIVVLKKN